jgi:hypothetical protein
MISGSAIVVCIVVVVVKEEGVESSLYGQGILLSVSVLPNRKRKCFQKKNKKNKKIASIVLSTRRSSVHVVCAPFGLFSRNSKSMRISVRFQTRIRTTVVSYSSIVE